MGLLDWLFRRPRFTRFEDSFAMDRENLWPSLRDSIAKQRRDGFQIWIVTHFADTFSELQDLFDQWDVEYQIGDQLMQPQFAVETSRKLGCGVLLTLAELLTPAESVDREIEGAISLSLIVVEKHPLVENDRRLESFARMISCPVRFGYFMAIDDIVVRRAVNDTTIQILKQLGMKDHELITSIMITRRLETVLSRESAKFTTNHRADSAAQWYKLNLVREDS